MYACPASSAPTTVMRKRKTASSFPFFVREIEFIDELEESSKTNQIYLDGYICKEPVYRKTPSGKGDRRRASCREPSLREIGLHPLHLLGQKTPASPGASVWETTARSGDASRAGNI